MRSDMSTEAVRELLHALIERALDPDTTTRVVFLVHEEETLSVQSIGVNAEELNNMLFHSVAAVSHAHPQPDRYQ